MKILRLALPACFLSLILFFSGCASDSENLTPTARDIVVTLRNLEEARAVHMYFEGNYYGPNNLVNPQSSIQVTVTAQRVGHTYSFYVKDAADPEGIALWTDVSIRVTEQSYNSQTAELHWTGETLLKVGW
jgi:hypothetical protein